MAFTASILLKLIPKLDEPPGMLPEIRNESIEFELKPDAKFKGTIISLKELVENEAVEYIAVADFSAESYNVISNEDATFDASNLAETDKKVLPDMDNDGLKKNSTAEEFEFIVPVPAIV